MQIGSPEWNRRITTGAEQLGLRLTVEQVGLFGRHARELLKWNAVTNLTAITDPAAMARDHYLDSLAPAGWIARGSELLDVGSGGGFPGLPLHLVVPDLHTTLIDAVRKKVSFLRHVVRELDLKGIQALHGRVQDLVRQPQQARRYDVIVSRAVGARPDWVKAVLPLLAPGGRVIVLRGAGTSAEAEELRRAIPGAGVDRRSYTLSGLKQPRHLVIVSLSELK
jgi:16S rRNA (guanine527-N7)-methyltransferase